MITHCKSPLQLQANLLVLLNYTTGIGVEPVEIEVGIVTEIVIVIVIVTETVTEIGNR